MIIRTLCTTPIDNPLTCPQQTHSGNSDISQGMNPGNQAGNRRAFTGTRDDSSLIFPTQDK